MNDESNHLDYARRLLRYRAPESHPESSELVAYAEGRLGPDEEEELREHLSLCEECLEVLDGLEGFAELDPADVQVDMAAVLVAGRRHRLLDAVLAASLIIALTAALALWRELEDRRAAGAELAEQVKRVERTAAERSALIESLEEQLKRVGESVPIEPASIAPTWKALEPNPVIVFLRPARRGIRGGGETDVEVVLGDARDLTLVAYSSDAKPGLTVGLRVRGGSGEVAVEEVGLERRESMGAFSLRIPADWLAKGRYEVELFTSSEGHEEVIETYVLRVESE